MGLPILAKIFFIKVFMLSKLNKFSFNQLTSLILQLLKMQRSVQQLHFAAMLFEMNAQISRTQLFIVHSTNSFVVLHPTLLAQPENEKPTLANFPGVMSK